MALINFAGGETSNQREANANSGTWSLQTSVKHSGAYAYRINPVTTAIGYLQFVALSTSGITSNPNVAKMRTTLWLRIDTAPASNHELIFVQRDTTNAADKFSLGVNSSRNVLCFDKDGTLVQTGTTVIALSTFVCLEIECNNGTSGDYIVRLAEVVELSGTCNQSATNCGAIRVGKVANLNSNSVDYYFDDIVLDDSDWHGDIGIAPRRPISNGSTSQWDQGTAADYTPVDEVVPDDDTTYIMNQLALGQVHLFGLETCATAGIAGPIKASKTIARAKENISVTSSFAIRVRSSATNSDTSGRNIGTSYDEIMKINTTDPATGSAWTESGLNASEAGVLENTALQVRCTQLFQTVLYSRKVSVAATDTATASATEAKTLASSSTRTDTATAQSTEASTNSSSLLRSDTTTASSSEVMNSVSVSLSQTDTATASTTETATIAVSLSRVDTATSSTTESSTSVVSSSRADTASVSASESKTLAVSSSRTDTATISVSEATSAAVALQRTDTATASTSEISALSIALIRTDTASVSVSEQRTIVSSSSRTDTATVSITDVTMIDQGAVLLAAAYGVAANRTFTEQGQQRSFSAPAKLRTFED